MMEAIVFLFATLAGLAIFFLVIVAGVQWILDR